VLPQLPALAKKINSLSVAADLSPKILGFSRPKFFRGLAWSIFGLAGILMVAGLVIYPVFDGVGLFRFSLSYSVPLWMANVLLVYLMAAGSSYAHRALALSFFIGGLGWLGLVFSSCALINGSYDKSESTEVVAMITYKYTTKSKNRVSYYVEFETPFDQGATHSQSVSHRDYNDVVLNQSSIKLLVNDGALGFKWQASYEINP